MVQHSDDLAIMLTSEMGKPFAEAKGGILYRASYIEWFAEKAKRTCGHVILGHRDDKRILVLKRPVRVVGGITPWNFPNTMIARKVARTLVAGCATIHST